MIAYLKGTVAGVDAAMAVIDVNGIGYAVGMSARALSRLPQPGEPVQVFTSMQVREDDISLYGFLSLEERDLFKQLIEVSGIGPKAALGALSTYEPGELIAAVLAEDVAALSRIPGVGKKTASRIVLELKGSLEKGTAQSTAQVAKSARKGAAEALLSMGFTPTEAEVSLDGAPEDADETALLQYALKRLGS